MSDKSETAQREEKILSFWKENKIFEKSLEKDSPKGEFVFYDGPPFATGLPHYGHILPGTIKDVIPRYKTMQGYRVPRRWGWDCHGLPIENLVEKELGLETKRDIEKFGVAEFNERAKASVLRFEKEWKEIIPRTGRWVDMDNAYKTMDSSYTQSVWWSFKNLYDKKLVYQGFKSMHLCPRCGTTLSNFEVNLGYKDITDLSVTAKFELIDEPKTYILAWTTTPWTLPGNAALAMNPEIQYSVVLDESDGSKYILASSQVEKMFKDKEHKVLNTLTGRELNGKKYKTLFDYYMTEGQVYLADFVADDEGTGVVHIAPAFGEEDYELSLAENIPFIQHVDMGGLFKPEVKDFAGETVKPRDDHQSTDIKIIKYLAAHGSLFSKEKIIHSYPHCWRCDTPLLNYGTSSWFVKVTEIKEKLLENNSKVKWVPEDIGDGRFGKWLEGARDWAVSRSRFWGTPLPVWQSEGGSESLLVDSVETLKKFTKRNGNKFIFVRHGEAEHNVQGICNSDPAKEYHLTEKGRQQIEKVAQQIQSADVIYTSPFIRTKETAEILARELRIGRTEEDVRLVDLNFGSFDAKPFSDYLEYKNTHIKSYDTPLPEGESFLDAKKRFGEFLYEIDGKHKGETIVVVTHGIGIETVKALIEGADMNRSKEIMDTCSVETGEVFEFDFVPLPRNDNFELDLHKPYIDSVILEKDGTEYKRVPEVFDTWYDSGSVPFASRAARDFRPADFIAEGLDQTRGWFYTMLVLGTALFGESPYKQVVVNGLVLAEDGKKMSKRLNNYPDITEVLDKYGADALRYFLVSSPAVHAEDVSFSEKGLDDVVKKIINRLYNVVSFYELYLSESSSVAGPVVDHVLDRWIDTRLAQTRESITSALESYELDKASRPLADFVDDLSTWYLRRSRNRPDALPKLRGVIIEFSKLMAPFMPFAAEDLYLRLQDSEGVESVHLAAWPDAEVIDYELLKDMVTTRQLVSLALDIRQKAGVKVRQPLAELRIKSNKLSDEYLELIRDELNVKKVVVDTNMVEEVELDTNITPELEEEGRVRDIVRVIQDLRKERGLRPGEKMQYDAPSEQKELFNKYGEEIKKATDIEF